MKKIDGAFITTTAGMAFKSGVLAHLQQSYQEVLNALAQLIVGNFYDPTKVYILTGCLNSGTGLVYIVTAGYVFFNGEVYGVDAGSFTAAGGQVAIGNIVTTFATGATGDPVEHTDGSTHNVLQIRKAVLSGGATTTGGLPDYSTWLQAASPSVYRLLVSAWGTGFGINFRQDQSIFFTTGAPSGTTNLVWDFSGAIPGTVIRVKVPVASGGTVNVATPAGSNVVNMGGAFVANKTNYFVAEYMGINEAGNNEVAYSVISL